KRMLINRLMKKLTRNYLEILRLASTRSENNHSSDRKNIDQITTGQSVKIDRIFTSDDVEAFARLTNDFNPIHLNKNDAIKFNFPDRIVHGALINGAISSVIGTILPGNGSILLHQDLNFPNPCNYHTCD
ncbi:Hydroxyacyl-thioester dehydratase type 2, partial [Sarcoptes scabiei]